MFTSAFIFVLGGSFPIMLPLCNPVIPPLAVSCFCINSREYKDVKIKPSPIIFYERIIGEDMTNRENNVS